MPQAKPHTRQHNTKEFERVHKNEIVDEELNSMNFDQLTERFHSLETQISTLQKQPKAPQKNCPSSSLCPSPPTPSSCPVSLLSDPPARRWPEEGIPLEAKQVRDFLKDVYSAKKSASELPTDTWFSEDPKIAQAAETKLVSEFSEPAGVPETRGWEQAAVPEQMGNFSIETPISAFPVAAPWPKSKGFIYVIGSAYGEKSNSFLYLREVILSCASIKNKSPGLNITIITTPTVIRKLSQAMAAVQPNFKRPLIDFVWDFYKIVDAVGKPMRGEILRRTRYLPWPHGGYIIKTIGMLLTPYERTIFLDTDTYFCEQPDPIFALLDRFDAAATDDVFRHWGSSLTPGFPQNAKSVMYDINGGLLAYKWNGYVTKWLTDTVAEFHSRHYPGMQGVLSGLLWAQQDLNFWLLGKEWNCHLVKTRCGEKYGEPRYAIPCRMLHSHALISDTEPPEEDNVWKGYNITQVRKIMYTIL